MAHFFSDTQLIVAYVIFFASYLVFAIGRFPGTKIDRPAAMIGAALMFAFRIISPEMAMRSIDFATIVSTLAGNLTITGSVANIIVVKKPETSTQSASRNICASAFPLRC